MSEFHYVRTRGADGGVDACEGPAIGLDLETVLGDGLPPWNIALEIVAALCEILDIADEDGEIHGEIDPKYVFIDETGAVSLEGFGIKRKKGRAPEGPVDTRGDLYGLGYTAYRCFCSAPLPASAAGSESHDETIIDAVLRIDLSGVPPAMQGDIQWYVAKLMEFDPSQRPTALEAWRTFVAFANGWNGIDMAEWCAAALDGGGARRTESAAPNAPAAAVSPAPTPPPVRTVAAAAPASPPPEEDEFDGPVVQKGPLSGRVAFEEGGGGGGSSGGKNATAFWTREDMKRAITGDQSLDEATPAVTRGAPSLTPFEPTSTDGGRARPPSGQGGGQATAFWSQAQLEAMERGDADAPRPRRNEGEGERRRVTAAQRPPPPATYSGPRTKSRGPSTGRLAPAPRAEGPPPSASGATPTVPAPAPVPAANAPAPAARSLPDREAPNAPTQAAPAPAAVDAPVGHSSPTGQLQAVAPKPAPSSTARTIPAPPPPAPPPAEGGGGLTFVLFGGGIAAVGAMIALVVALIALVILVVVAWPSADPAPPPLPTPVVRPAPDVAAPVPAAAPEPAPVAPEPAPEPAAPAPKPAAPKPAAPAPKPAAPKPAAPKPAAPKPAAPKPAAPAPKPAAPAPRPSPRPRPAAPGANATVTLKSGGAIAVSGCVSQKLDFVGRQSFVIEGYLLPASCLVTIDGARGVFTVNGTGDVTCDKQGTAVLCDKQSVP